MYFNEINTIPLTSLYDLYKNVFKMLEYRNYNIISIRNNITEFGKIYKKIIYNKYIVIKCKNHLAILFTTISNAFKKENLKYLINKISSTNKPTHWIIYIAEPDITHKRMIKMNKDFPLLDIEFINYKHILFSLPEYKLSPNNVRLLNKKEIINFYEKSTFGLKYKVGQLLENDENFYVKSLQIGINIPKILYKIDTLAIWLSAKPGMILEVTRTPGKFPGFSPISYLIVVPYEHTFYKKKGNKKQNMINL